MFWEIGPSDVIYSIPVNLDPSLTWTWASITPFMVLNHLEGKNAGASWALGLCSPLCKDINAIPVEDIHGFQVSGIQLSLSQQLLDEREKSLDRKYTVLVWHHSAAASDLSVLSPPLVFILSLIGCVPFFESNKDTTSIQVSGVKKCIYFPRNSCSFWQHSSRDADLVPIIKTIKTRLT